MTKTKPSTKSVVKKIKSAAKPAAKPAVKKVKSSRPAVKQQPLVTGQLWRVADMNLRVGLIGKILVHYKLAKPNASAFPTPSAAKPPSKNISRSTRPC